MLVDNLPNPSGHPEHLELLGAEPVKKITLYVSLRKILKLIRPLSLIWRKQRDICAALSPALSFKLSTGICNRLPLRIELQSDVAKGESTTNGVLIPVHRRRGYLKNHLDGGKTTVGITFVFQRLRKNFVLDFGADMNFSILPIYLI